MRLVFKRTRAHLRSGFDRLRTYIAVARVFTATLIIDKPTRGYYSRVINMVGIGSLRIATQKCIHS